MAINQVKYGNTTLIDLTDTTATASDVASGKYFYGVDGVRTLGTATGGASNLVQGTFTTPSSAGVTNLNISYTGSGYPLMITVVVDGGAYASGTSWYSSTQRYAVGHFSMTKSNFTLTPSYGTSGAANQGVVCAIYKNSTSSSTSYTRTSGMNVNFFSSSNAANSATTCVRYHENNILSYYTNTSSYGLLPSTTYRYFIVYSS